MRHFLFICLLSITSLFIHGYRFGVSDQEIFIPYILKWQDQTLFQKDDLFNQISAHTSAFYPIFGYISKLINIEVVFFISYIIFKFLFFCAIFKLAKTILKNNNLAFASLLMFIMPKFIGGTATSTFDDFFGYRSLGSIFLIYYIACCLEGKLKSSLLFAMAGFLFHPLSIIANAPILAVIFIRNKFKLNTKKLFLILGIVGLVALGISLQLPQDDQWFSVIKQRNNFLLVSSWGVKSFLSLFLYLGLILYFVRKIFTKTKKDILIITTVCLLTFVINILVFDVLKNPELAKFQLVRSITPLAYIGLAMCPMFLIGKKLHERLVGWACFISLSLNLFYIFIIFFAVFFIFDIMSKNSQSFKLKDKTIFILITTILILGAFSRGLSFQRIANKIQYPKPLNDWINLQLWAKSNTAKSSIFLVPPTQTGFRIYSQRPIVGDMKDGAVAIYSSSYAKKWSEANKDFKNYDSLTETDVNSLKEKYGFSFLVNPKDASNNNYLKFNVVYKNGSFVVYKL
ncbi:MAG: hypothetical protein Q8P10_02775 [bacterium]|nr:hypothetical protein [bacterium]